MLLTRLLLIVLLHRSRKYPPVTAPTQYQPNRKCRQAVSCIHFLLVGTNQKLDYHFRLSSRTGHASTLYVASPFSSTDDLNKFISESLERIRQSTSTDAIHPIVLATMELLKSSGRDDLCTQFTSDLHTVIAEWRAVRETAANKDDNDNLNEENMEVDEEQDDKLKKQVSESEFNDVDYRFLDQDMDHRVTTDVPPDTTQHKDSARKSRFSDLFTAHRDADDRSLKTHPATEGNQ